MATRDGLTETVPLWRVALLARTLAACGLFARSWIPSPTQQPSRPHETRGRVGRSTARYAQLSYPNIMGQQQTMHARWGDNDLMS